ncbi:TetR/AcrR family transcriptional regulator [Kribbia dieselivorans]|uniref:TetR/AcrR family transcriptional regulator n=1 Tax=Kribbia dieselivorans TaxID=331526 RepID=UPI0008382042|nr:TetR family transcriptional regulator [Kribbia dieselivorans]
MTSRTRESTEVRRARILAAAATLFSDRDYARVSMSDIAGAVGMAASTIYWHFSGKQEILVTLFDECLDALLSDEAQAIAAASDPLGALRAIVRRHVDFVVHERRTAQTYYRQAGHIAEADAGRIRTKQRAYIGGWSDLLVRARPDLSAEEAEQLVRAAIGALQSDLYHHSARSIEQRQTDLSAIAGRVLGLLSI